MIAAGPAGLILKNAIVHEVQLAPHKPHSLRVGCCALYVFSLSERYGHTIPAGAHRVLKVGKAGQNSNARFQSQHYSPGSAPSTLAACLIRTRVLWPYLGLASMSEDRVRDWLQQHTERDNFYLSADDEIALGEFEKFLRGRLGPVFEGS
jgi:hypothetical protein